MRADIAVTLWQGVIMDIGYQKIKTEICVEESEKLRRGLTLYPCMGTLKTPDDNIVSIDFRYLQLVFAIFHILDIYTEKLKKIKVPANT